MTMYAYNSSTEGAHWPLSLAATGNFQFSERPWFKAVRQRVMIEGTQCLPLASLYPHTHVHATHTLKCMQHTHTYSSACNTHTLMCMQQTYKHLSACNTQTHVHVMRAHTTALKYMQHTHMHTTHIHVHATHRFSSLINKEAFLSEHIGWGCFRLNWVCMSYTILCRWMILRVNPVLFFGQLLREKVICVAAGLRHALATTGRPPSLYFSNEPILSSRAPGKLCKGCQQRASCAVALVERRDHKVEVIGESSSGEEGSERSDSLCCRHAARFFIILFSHSVLIAKEWCELKSHPQEFVEARVREGGRARDCQCGLCSQLCCLPAGF